MLYIQYMMFYSDFTSHTHPGTCLLHSTMKFICDADSTASASILSTSQYTRFRILVSEDERNRSIDRGVRYAFGRSE